MTLEEYKGYRYVTVNKLTLSRSQSRMEGAALPSSALDTSIQTYPHVTTITTSSALKPWCRLQGCQVYLYRDVNCPLIIMACTVFFFATTSRVKGKAENRNMLDPLALPHHDPQSWQRHFQSYYGKGWIINIQHEPSPRHYTYIKRSLLEDC